MVADPGATADIFAPCSLRQPLRFASGAAYGLDVAARAAYRRVLPGVSWKEIQPVADSGFGHRGDPLARAVRTS